jgi:hypothetical protein
VFELSQKFSHSRSETELEVDDENKNHFKRWFVFSKSKIEDSSLTPAAPRPLMQSKNQQFSKSIFDQFSNHKVSDHDLEVYNGFVRLADPDEAFLYLAHEDESQLDDMSYQYLDVCNLCDSRTLTDANTVNSGSNRKPQRPLKTKAPTQPVVPAPSAAPKPSPPESTSGLRFFKPRPPNSPPPLNLSVGRSVVPAPPLALQPNAQTPATVDEAAHSSFGSSISESIAASPAVGTPRRWPGLFRRIRSTVEDLSSPVPASHPTLQQQYLRQQRHRSIMSAGLLEGEELMYPTEVMQSYESSRTVMRRCWMMAIVSDAIVNPKDAEMYSWGDFNADDEQQSLPH